MGGTNSSQASPASRGLAATKHSFSNRQGRASLPARFRDGIPSLGLTTIHAARQQSAIPNHAPLPEPALITNPYPKTNTDTDSGGYNQGFVINAG
jgi:hypothetical protein